MSNAFDLLVNDEPLTKVFVVVAATDDAELRRQGQELNDQVFVQFATRASSTLQVNGVRQTITIGCMSHLFILATDNDARREFTPAFLEDSGIKRTQMYRCRGVWQRMGQILLREPTLMKQFVAESLKLVCEASAPDAVIEEACNIARQGERISIRLANELLSKHAPKSTQTTKEVVERRRPQKPTLSFAGQAVRVSVKPIQANHSSDLESTIRDLEAFVLELRQTLVREREQSATAAHA